jgi:hypothetical protein
MSDAQDADNPGLAIHRVYNPIIALTNSIEIRLPDQLFDAYGKGLNYQRLNRFVDADEVVFWNSIQVFENASLETKDKVHFDRRRRLM